MIIHTQAKLIVLQSTGSRLQLAIQEAHFLSAVTSSETPLLLSLPPVQHSVGSTVNLLFENSAVGTATVMDGVNIHCQAIPHGYTKISILDVKDNSNPMFETEFDDAFLCKNSITVWPSNQLCLSH